uniref:LAGLIDADG endonuclease n=1 Tax=Ramaria rubella TaxID=113071 RepID=UPI00223903E2|nr:LAGLIDADG endonuclease [Ramaria rubella]UYR22231.1 LAGLIDADG endonuclease [Ramaria rubella]
MKLKMYIPKLLPYGITGYFDGEGCFSISVYKNIKMKTGYSITVTVEIKQHKNSENILYGIKSYFNEIGSITSHNNISRYKVSSINDIKRYIVPHFDKYPLLSSKQLNYLDFKKIIKLISDGDHLNSEGIIEIKKISSEMNINRSFLDKWSFFSKQDSDKNILLTEALKPEWVQSFTDSEGNFNYYYREFKSGSISFSISQNLHDYPLLIALKKFFGAGKIYPLSLDGRLESAKTYLNKSKNLGLSSVIRYEISSKILHKEIIIPFFKKYPLYTTKNLDFEDWIILINMSDAKEYKTMSGKEKMIAISKGMNRGRKVDLPHCGAAEQRSSGAAEQRSSGAAEQRSAPHSGARSRPLVNNEICSSPFGPR